MQRRAAEGEIRRLGYAGALIGALAIYLTMSTLIRLRTLPDDAQLIALLVMCVGALALYLLVAVLLAARSGGIVIWLVLRFILPSFGWLATLIPWSPPTAVSRAFARLVFAVVAAVSSAIVALYVYLSATM